MALRKKSFECGHGGKGRFCHRCVDEKRAADASLAAVHDEQRRLEERSRRWDMRFEEQRGECYKFPGPVGTRAIALAESLCSGMHYSRVGGHRLTPDPSKVRFALPMRYRMVGVVGGAESLKGLQVMSHAEYNRFFRE